MTYIDEYIIQTIGSKWNNGKEKKNQVITETKSNDGINIKKLCRFVEEYEKHQDTDTYEWIKYKVAAEIGGEEEREAFKLYEKIKTDELGETRIKLLRKSSA